MSTIIIGSIVFLLMALAIRQLVRQKKQGICSGTCGNCGSHCKH